MNLSKAATEAVLESIEAQAYLMIAFKKSQKTIQTWLTSKAKILTTKEAMEIISRETGIPEDEIIVNEKAIA